MQKKSGFACPKARFHLREATPVQASQEAHWRQRSGCLAKQDPNEKRTFESQRMQNRLTSFL